MAYVGAAIATIAIVVLAVLAVNASGHQLPGGFTIQHADGITYVCSTTPVQCTGNK